MNREEAFQLMDNMVTWASREIALFTKSNKIISEGKPDGSAVTACDLHLDRGLTQIATNLGLQVVSEEGLHNLDFIRSGNYATIDPIDGTLGYLEHCKHSRGPSPHISRDIGSEFDYALLVGIVENGIPRFGCAYSYVTGEKILIDSEGYFERGGKKRRFNARCARYIDNRIKSEDRINARLSDPPTETFRFSSLGLASLYLQLNGHDSAALAHFPPQRNGLWDVVPALVSCSFTDTAILDGNGHKISLTDDVWIPKGVVLYKGRKFSWVKDCFNPV
jgi:fructose-1,6-bisphosphatase/inositol monophosphatase family enzyme